MPKMQEKRSKKKFKIKKADASKAASKELQVIDAELLTEENLLLNMY